MDFSVLSKLNIQALVPHRGTMLLLDELIMAQEDSVRTKSRIRNSMPFIQASGLPSWVGIELMAQSIAAWSGCRAYTRNEPAQIGFLLGTRKYRCSENFFSLHSALEIEVVRELFDSNGMGMFRCHIEHAGRILVRANLSVFEPPQTNSNLSIE